MVTTPAYPFNLATVQAGKSRSQPPSFSMREPRRGMGYVQRIGTDTPVFWQVQFRFSRGDAVRFQLWFVYDIERGSLPFTLPLRTEFGDVVHTCQFLPESLLDHGSDGDVHTYSATIMARAQIIPQAYIDARPMIEALPDWLAYAGSMDSAVDALPEGPLVYAEFLLGAAQGLASFARADAAPCATRFNSFGLMVVEAANVPRIDYDPLTLQCLGLMVEPQRTNLLTRSGALNAAAWTKAGSPIITPDARTAPDGTAAMEKHTPASGAAESAVSQSHTGLTPGGDAVTSIYAAAGERSIMQIRWFGSGTGVSSLYANFDVSSGAIGGNASVRSVQQLQGGLWRVVARVNGIGTLAGQDTGFEICDTLSDGRRPTITGDGVGGLYWWGAQTEDCTGSAVGATSLIQTTSAAVTRAADVPRVTLPQACDVLIQDRGGAYWHDAQPAGAYTLQPRSGQRHIGRVRAWRTGTLSSWQKQALAVPAA